MKSILIEGDKAASQKLDAIQVSSLGKSQPLQEVAESRQGLK